MFGASFIDHGNDVLYFGFPARAKLIVKQVTHFDTNAQSFFFTYFFHIFPENVEGRVDEVKM